MGASLLRKKVKEAGLDVTVTNTAISTIPSDSQIVITQEKLTPRAENKVPEAYHISVDNFLSSPEYDQLIDRLQTGVTGEQHELVEESEAVVPDNTEDDQLLLEENVFLNQKFRTKEEAIRFAGRALVRGGYVEESYVDEMMKREEITTTYMATMSPFPTGQKTPRNLS